jgi:hypothetical protein
VKKLLLIISLICGLTVISLGQTMNKLNTRAKMKSMYISNFAKYTEWPAEYKQGEFVVGVVNDDALATMMETMAKTKTINGQKMVIKRFSSPSEITKCHLIYVAGKASGEVQPYVSKVSKFSCLIVTEGAGLIDNLSAINFLTIAGPLKFEMNKKTFNNQELIVSTLLENLATKVIK